MDVQTLHSCDTSRPMALIKSIRRDYGCDEEYLRHMDNRSRQTIAALKKATAGSLQALSQDLYTKSSHFVLEFVQNADDNQYRDGIIPTLDITFEPNRVVISCNEVGFTSANVKAICAINASTKQKAQGYIGDKGIGFKSVFKVAGQVYISSGEYTFMLSRNGDCGLLGMIAPSWTERHPVRRGWTDFHLYLADEQDSNKLNSYAQDIQPTLLLFLRKLRNLSLLIKQRGCIPESIRLTREDIGSDVVRLHDSRSTPQKYFMVKYQTKTYPGEEKRKGIEESEVVLAFPLNNEGTPSIKRQAVHAFLPLRQYGFSFIVQADFLTSSNREDILDNEWNIQLRNAVVNAFSTAVERFKQDGGLRFTWLRFLPEIQDEFFWPVAHEIVRDLNRSHVLLTATNGYRLPAQCVIAPSFKDDDGNPLLAEEYLGGSHYYLSPLYDLPTDTRHITRLGCCVMSDTQFLRGLQNMGHRIREKQSSWHETVCRALIGIMARSRSPYPEIRKIRIIPLSGRSWVSAQSVMNVFFHSDVSGVPSDLGLQLVDPRIKQGSFQYQLLQALGVRRADPISIITKILEQHHHNTIPPDLDSLIGHARFMYAYRNSVKLPQPLILRVMSDKSQVSLSRDTYFDFPDLQCQVKLSAILPSPAIFLHPEYLKNPDWSNWLRDVVGINTSPRLIDGQLSPEFIGIHNVDTRTFLTVLKEAWPKWQQTISQTAVSCLKDTVVQCEDGNMRALKTCCLKRRSLKDFSDLPFISVEYPDNASWDFLRCLDVVDQVDGKFFLQRLISLKESGTNDVEQVLRIYRQLGTRFDECSDLIRDAFERQPLILIFDNEKRVQRWIGKEHAVWAGPRSTNSKIAIQKLYDPILCEFFQQQLKIPDAGPEVLVVELEAIARESFGKYISKFERDQVYGLLRDMSQALEGDSQAHLWLQRLADIAIFPVKRPSGWFELCNATGDFYIPDRKRKFMSIFASDISILSIPANSSLTDILPVLESNVFSSRLRRLESLVTLDSEPHGRKQLQTELSKRFANISPFVERLILSKRSKTPPTLAEKLSNIEIFTVDRIESFLKLGNLKHEYDEKLIIKANDQGLSVFITREASTDTRDILICDKLADLLNVDMPSLVSFVSLPVYMVEEMLKIQNIPELPDGHRTHLPDASTAIHTVTRVILDVSPGSDRTPSDDVDVGATPPIRHDSTPVTGARASFAVGAFDDVDVVAGPPVGRDHAPMAGSRRSFPIDVDNDSNPDEESNLEVNLLCHMAAGLTIEADTVVVGGRREPGLTDFSESLTIASDVAAAYIDNAFTRVNKIRGFARPSSSSRGGHSLNVRPKVTIFQQDNGRSGEFLVYTKLSKILPGFGPDNWTSETRGGFPGFEPYAGTSWADFIYKDDQGTLTSFLLGDQTKAAWRDAWPTYHLEVKTTSGVEGEKFYMSELQCEHASRLSMRDSRITPTHLYVLIRVSSIRSQSPDWRFFVDPHHLLYEGRLRIVSDIALESHF